MGFFYGKDLRGMGFFQGRNFLLILRLQQDNLLCVFVFKCDDAVLKGFKFNIVVKIFLTVFVLQHKY